MWFLVCLWLASATAATAFDPSQYSNSTRLHATSYTLYWRTDERYIYLGFEVRTRGWIGFGLSEPSTGSMIGSDMLVSEVTGGGVGPRIVRDMYATEFAWPSEDACGQDWELLAYESDVTSTYLEVARLLDTGDVAQDRAIVPGPMKIVFAWGAGNVVSYHSGQVGAHTVSFIEPSPAGTSLVALPGDAYAVAVAMVEVPVAAGRDYAYYCKSFELPLAAQQHHVVQVDLIADPNTAHVLQHLNLYICDNSTALGDNYVLKYAGVGGECSVPALGNPASGCHSLMVAWARGMTSVVLPQEAGFFVGAASSRHVVLEAHYSRTSSVVYDDSGLRLWVTPSLRQHNAATLLLGDPLLSLSPPIPPRVSLEHYETECPSVCTERLHSSLHVFGASAHLRQVGAQIWTSHHAASTGELLGYIDRHDYYDTNYHAVNPASFVVHPGDRLNTHCTYTTTSRTNETAFALGSADEICLHILFYYPATAAPSDPAAPFVFCGHHPDPSATLCGSNSGIGDGSSVITAYPNPSVTDPVDDRAREFGGSCQ